MSYRFRPPPNSTNYAANENHKERSGEASAQPNGRGGAHNGNARNPAESGCLSAWIESGVRAEYRKGQQHDLQSAYDTESERSPVNDGRFVQQENDNDGPPWFDVDELHRGGHDVGVQSDNGRMLYNADEWNVRQEPERWR